MFRIGRFSQRVQRARAKGDRSSCLGFLCTVFKLGQQRLEALRRDGWHCCIVAVQASGSVITTDSWEAAHFCHGNGFVEPCIKLGVPYAQSSQLPSLSLSSLALTSPPPAVNHRHHGNRGHDQNKVMIPQIVIETLSPRPQTWNNPKHPAQICRMAFAEGWLALGGLRGHHLRVFVLRGPLL